MRLWCAILLLCTCSSPLARAADCKQSDARYQDLGCAAQALSVADRELNDHFTDLMSHMDQQGKERLRDAQRAWTRFRDADTRVALYVSGEGGSLGSLIATNHNLDLTLERIKQLNEVSDTVRH